MAKLLYGHEIAEANYQYALKILKTMSHRLSYNKVGCELHIIQRGSNPASNIYVRKKLLAVQKLNDLVNSTEEFKGEANFTAHLEQLSSSSPFSDIMDLIRHADSPVIPQFPMFNKEDDAKLTGYLNGKYDIDGLSNESKLDLYNGKPSIIPCTAKAVLDVFHFDNYELKGKVVMIAGKSDLVGKPLIHLLLAQGATVISINSKTPRDRIKPMLSQADVLITAIGVPKYFNSEIVPDCLDYIVDVGISKDKDGNISGDVDSELYDMLSDSCTITPVPKGVGVITVSNVIVNLVQLYKNIVNRRSSGWE